MAKKKKKINYGKVDLLPKEDTEPKNIKVRISMMVEGDLLEAYKKAAKLTLHGEYQTLMKEKLREGLQPKKTNQFSEQELDFLRVSLRPAFIEIVDKEIEERIQPKALKRA